MPGQKKEKKNARKIFFYICEENLFIVVWIKITTFFKRRVSIILWNPSFEKHCNFFQTILSFVLSKKIIFYSCEKIFVVVVRKIFYSCEKDFFLAVRKLFL